MAALSSPTRPSPPLVIGKRITNGNGNGDAVADFDALYDSGGRVFFGLDNSDVLEVLALQCAIV